MKSLSGGIVPAARGQPLKKRGEEKSLFVSFDMSNYTQKNQFVKTYCIINKFPYCANCTSAEISILRSKFPEVNNKNNGNCAESPIDSVDLKQNNKKNRRFAATDG